MSGTRVTEQNQKLSELIHKGGIWKQFSGSTHNSPVLCPCPEVSSLPLCTSLASSHPQASAQMSPCHQAPPWPPCLNQVTQSMLPQCILLSSFTALIEMNNYMLMGMFACLISASVIACEFTLGAHHTAHSTWHRKDSECLLKKWMSSLYETEIFLHVTHH